VLDTDRTERRELDAAEMRVLSAVSGHRLIGPRRKEDITEELEIFDTN
jgi:hypothetical protein